MIHRCADQGDDGGRQLPDIPSRAGDTEYRIYSDLAEIGKLAPAWDELLASGRGNRAFASAEWYIASCRIRKPVTPYVVVARSGARITGILPLVLNSEQGLAEFPHYGNDYNDMLALDDEPAWAAHLLSYALTSYEGCRKALLSRLRPDSYCLAAVPFIRQNSNVNCRYQEINVYPRILLPASFDDYLASRSKSFRKSIRRVLRDIEQAGLTIREVHPDGFAPEELTELLISMALSRQKEKSFLKETRVQTFVREVLPPLFAKRHVRAFVMFDAEQAVALDLCMAAGDGLATWNGGFLSSAERWSPGTALFAFGINRAIEMGLKEYDFAEGKEAYKTSWVNGSYVVGEIELARLT